MGQDWSTVSFSNRPQSAASSSHQKQQGLKDAQRMGGQIETSAKSGGGKNGGLSAAQMEAHRLDNDTGEGSRAPLPPPHWRKPPRPCRIREPRSACMVGGVVRARLTLCSVRGRHGVRDEGACADASTMPAQMRRCLQS